MNGWYELNDSRQINTIENNLCGFHVDFWSNNQIYRVGILIKNKRFGNIDEYKFDGEYDFEKSGFFENHKKI